MMTTSMTTIFCACLVASAFFPFAANAQDMPLPVTGAAEQGGTLRGSASLGPQWLPVTSAEGQQVVSPKIEKAFLLEIQAALDTNFLETNKDRMAEITKSLAPMFASLDKNEYGKLGHTAVRYALHRLFVSRHGWLMQGLDPAGQHFNSSSPVEVLKGKTSVRLQGIFEKRLVAQGFGLQELSVFASLLETLVATEASERLNALFEKMDIILDEQLDEAQVDNLIDLYMTEFILGRQVEGSSKKQLLKLKESMPTVYSFWAETQKLVRDVRKEVLGKRDIYTHVDIEKVLVQIGERFGKWQSKECEHMKQRLVNLETDEKGCVPLSTFYKGVVASGGEEWQFGENLEYLKQNGIIDESDPDNLKVMIANYMNAPANCIASSHYYAVCCIDECESLVGHIESRVGWPTATPRQLVALVSELSSSTVPANRTLPPSQTHRLDRIADKHGGRIPIHGRLFMQWMHLVYPRECAYPHISGTTNPLTPEAWEESMERDTSASIEEMAKFVNAPASGTSSGQGQCGRWVDEEELFVGGPTTQRRNLRELETDLHTWMATSSVALLCVLAATVLAVIHTIKSMKRAFCGGWKQKSSQPLMLV